MNPLIDTLEEYVASGIPIGYCPWEDGDGMLWGRILEVGDGTFRVQNLSTLGRDEEIEEYLFSDIVYFDVDPIYAQRLALLANFEPTLPEETDEITDSEEIAEIFSKAFKSGEIIRIYLPGETELDVTIGQIGFGWAEVTYYGDTMIPKGNQWINIDKVESLTWRNRRSEADGYLLKLVK
jgi:hypothetical protein